jgi:hypothetical protein
LPVQRRPFSALHAATAEPIRVSPPKAVVYLGLIKIDTYEDKTENGQLLVLGSLTNNGSKPASSIQLEAELFDDNGKFVYECNKYISNRVMPGESENFQIKCGCRDSMLPKYRSMNIRIVSVHNF